MDAIVDGYDFGFKVGWPCTCVRLASVQPRKGVAVASRPIAAPSLQFILIDLV